MSESVDREITPKQRAVYEMRKGGATFEEIAEGLNIAIPTAAKHLKAAVANGLPALPKYAAGKMAWGHDSEIGTALADAVQAEGEAKREIFINSLKAQGVPYKMAEALWRRASSFGGAKDMTKSLKVDQMVESLNEKTSFILEHIDAVSVGNSSLKDLAIAFGILTEKKLLLGGKPTQRIDVNVSHRLETLMPAFLAEAQRRGISLEGVVTAREIELESEGQA